jgi:hypothetical protein
MTVLTISVLVEAWRKDPSLEIVETTIKEEDRQCGKGVQCDRLPKV